MAIITSERFSLNKYDFKSLLVGLGITLTSAALTYLSQWLIKQDFGTWTPIIMTVWAFLVNLARKYITEKEYVK